MLRKLIPALILCLLLALGASCALAETGMFAYRFADAQEGAELLLGNRDYYENLTQDDLNFRLQKLDATLEELEAFAAQQTVDFNDLEKEAIHRGMADIEAICRERGYTLPQTDEIVFIRTTMKEECLAAGYTHGTQIYLGEYIMQCGVVNTPTSYKYFLEILSHELFHCLTRNNPDFRAGMYALLGFTVTESDFEFPPEIRERIISNPDVERHDSYAAFDIGGEMKDCAVIFITGKPFEQPGDTFFDTLDAGLVPIDDLGTLYVSEDAANFWDVFGENTDYVVDPEETLAENFSFLFVHGLEDGRYATPELIEAIDAYLREGASQEKDAA